MRALLVGVIAGLFLGCGGEKIRDPTEGEIEFEPDRPLLPGATETVPPYTGTEPLVIEATNRYVTGLDLHRKLIMRSCGPLNGVCHNTKEYPDLHTPANMVEAIDAPCNMQPGSFASVFDRCERPGDRFHFADSEYPEIEVGWIEHKTGAPVDYTGDNKPGPDAPGFHVHLAQPLPGTRSNIYASGVFVRAFQSNGEWINLPFVSFQSSWWVMADRTHLFAEVPTYRDEALESLMKGGIVQGDANRNGIFGYRTGKFVTLINPGKPEESYLVARLRGHMQGETVPGTRMPLANQPPSVPDMVALMCFIEGLDPAKQPYNMANPINYADCSYTADPTALNLVGKGITFSGKIKPLLQANCGGCHGGSNPQGQFDVVSEGVFDRLMLASKQQVARKLVDPGNLDTSYLWLKLSGDGSITGRQMPLDPLGSGVRPLSAEDLSAVETWIRAGALND